jgi:hypothetical protein
LLIGIQADGLANVLNGLKMSNPKVNAERRDELLAIRKRLLK